MKYVLILTMFFSLSTQAQNPANIKWDTICKDNHMGYDIAFIKQIDKGSYFVSYLDGGGKPRSAVFYPVKCNYPQNAFCLGTKGIAPGSVYLIGMNHNSNQGWLSLDENMSPPEHIDITCRKVN